MYFDHIRPPSPLNSFHICPYIPTSQVCVCGGRTCANAHIHAYMCTHVFYTLPSPVYAAHKLLDIRDLPVVTKEN